MVTCRDLETLWEFLGWGLEIMKKSFTKKKNSQFFVTIMMWQNVIGGNVQLVKKNNRLDLDIISSSIGPVEMMTCVHF